MHLFGVVVFALLVIGSAVFVTVTICARVAERSDRRHRTARVLQTQYRISQIKSSAQAQMWDEVTRHHNGGG